MEIINEKIELDVSSKLLKEILFLYNALDNGWTIKKRKDVYIFTKKHGEKKEVFENDYLAKFLNENTSLDKLLNKIKNEL